MTARVWAGALAALLLVAPGCAAEEGVRNGPAGAETGDPPSAPAPAGTEPGRFNGSEWQTASPESQGLDPERLARGIERVGALSGARSLLVVRNARIVAERSFAGSDLNRRPHDIKSASKSLLSALVGIALEEGWIDGLDATVAELLPGYAEGLPPEKRGIALADVLSMSAGLATTSHGHYGAWVSSSDWTRAALARPMTSRPGTEFTYSTGSSHLVSAILTEAAGESVLALAR
jgi:CubicO group peptidase (beta-lactamase class C family)